MMKEKAMYIRTAQSVIKKVLPIVFFVINNYSCTAQIDVNIDKDFYYVVNNHFTEKEQVLLLENTVKITKDITFLKDFENWNEANNAIENTSFDTLDFKNIFSKEELVGIVESFNRLKLSKISKENIEDNILLLGEEEYKEYNSFKYRVSAPVEVSTKNGSTYLFIYIDSINDSESGYGGIYIYIKDKKEWEHIFTYGLWIS